MSRENIGQVTFFEKHNYASEILTSSKKMTTLLLNRATYKTPLFAEKSVFGHKSHFEIISLSRKCRADNGSQMVKSERQKVDFMRRHNG